MRETEIDFINDIRSAGSLSEAKEVLGEFERKTWNEAIESAAKAAEQVFGGTAHTYASENADLYRGQDMACKYAARDIRKLKR